MEFLKERRNHIVLILIAGFFALGLGIGMHSRPASEKIIDLENKESEISAKTDFAPFWKVWNIIDEKSPNASKADDQKRVYSAIAGLMGSLGDPYSVFFLPDEAKSFEEQIAGNFSGVGMEVGIKNKILTVIAPIKDTPAYRAGIKAGDLILKIDDKITSDLGVDEAIKLIRGEKGTTVTITILHEGESDPKEIKIVRDVINIPTLDTETRPDGIFVIHLYSFTANSADLFRGAMKEFVESNSDKLILDLRGNPGGYLDAAVDISSWFLDGGKTVVTEDYGSNRKPTVYRSKGYNIFNDKLKFAILIDGGSASASEIVAGAMQDNKKAVLVGSQSFGKGSVQETVKVTPDTLLKITVAKWLTPNGNTIAEVGLTPDYKVEYTKKDKESKKDPQMDKAVEILLK
ncbi:MAG: S41 family peptidase [Candidatus Pacebacteria bacterium]|nr:S41 family peptidase [Candidatus Paceibacterota bacterium]